jgi:hypothetical protein
VRVAYDPDRHFYSDLDAGGCEVPGVTRIIKAAGLLPPYRDNGRGRNLGSIVHELCEADDLGTLDPADTAAAENPGLKAWRAFKAETFATVVEIEQMVWSEPHYFAGRFDRLVTIFGHPRPMLIDLKWNSRSKWHEVQTALYLVGKAERDGREPEDYEMADLYLLPSGRYSLKVPEDPGEVIQRSLGIVADYHAGRYAA